MSTPIATMIREMAAAGCPIEIIAKAVELAETHAQGVTPLRSSNATRQARYRERKAAKTVTNNVTTLRNTGETIEGEVLSLEKKKKERSLSRSPVTLVTPSRFPEFKSSYPRRLGPAGWAQAEKKFDRLVAKGISPDLLIDGAARYRCQQEALEKVGTEFVKMAQTWLNQEGWKDDIDVPAEATEEERFAAALRAVRSGAGSYG